MKQQDIPHVVLAGDISGRYVVTEKRPSGELVIKPDTSIEAISGRHDLEPATLADLEREHGPLALAPDDEG